MSALKCGVLIWRKRRPRWCFCFLKRNPRSPLVPSIRLIPHLCVHLDMIHSSTQESAQVAAQHMLCALMPGTQPWPVITEMGNSMMSEANWTWEPRLFGDAKVISPPPNSGPWPPAGVHAWHVHLEPSRPMAFRCLTDMVTCHGCSLLRPSGTGPAFSVPSPTDPGLRCLA